MSGTGELSGVGTIDKAAAQNPLHPNSASSQLSPQLSVPPHWIPEHSRGETAIAFGLFLLSFLYLCIFRRYTSLDRDEGIILQGAQRILDGHVLYRDFFSFFTPGSYYLIALVFRVFGDSFLAARTAVALVGAGFSPITYLLARRVCSRQTSLLVTLLMTVTTVPVRFLVLHNWDSTLLACLALYCGVRLLESPSAKWAFATASFASLTVLFEQSKGAGLGLGLGIGFLLITFSGQAPKLFTRGRLIAITLGLAWPVLVTVLYFASQHALRAMLADWFWPLQHYSTANRVPYGYQDLSEDDRITLFHSGSIGLRLLRILAYSPALWLPVLPLFAVALLPRLMVRMRRKSSFGPDWPYYMLISSTAAGLLGLAVVAVRPDRLHFFYLQPIFSLILAWLLGGRNVRGPMFKRLGPLLSVCAVVLLLPMAIAILLSAAGQHYTIVTRRGAVTTPSQDAVIDYVQARVEPGERILIYPYDPLYYFLTGTYSSTRFEYFQPGMNTSEQAGEMLNQLSAHPPRVVLYERSFADHIPAAWPNTPASALVNDPVAEYIVRQYRECSTLNTSGKWQFLFMVRKDLPCPNSESPSA
jgi:4-amino-4-deoxy-L-arabinose transferase-like glycosyltransferase